MKHLGLEEQRLAVYTWHFLSGFVLPAHDVPPCGERFRPTNHWPPVTDFYWAKETVVTKQLFASQFLTLKSLLRCEVLGVLCMNLSRGCGEDEGRQQAVRLLKR